MELTPEVDLICRKAASHTWRRVRDAQNVVNLDDLQNQARLVAWLSEDRSPGLLYHLLCLRLIDYMRSVSPIRSQPLLYLDDEDSYLDEPGDVDAGYLEIEDRAALEWVFSDDRGHPRGRTLAWLKLHGITLTAGGDHLGISRATASRDYGLFLCATRDSHQRGLVLSS